MSATHDVVGRCTECAHLAGLCCAVEGLQPGPDGVITPGLFDFRGDTELANRLGQGDMDLCSLGDRPEDQSARVLTRVGNPYQKSTTFESRSSAFQLVAIGGTLELEIGWARIGEGDAHRRSP